MPPKIYVHIISMFSLRKCLLSVSYVLGIVLGGIKEEAYWLLEGIVSDDSKSLISWPSKMV